MKLIKINSKVNTEKYIIDKALHESLLLLIISAFQKNIEENNQ
jgi:hypothetical protein